jgi:branched-subunit amino acid transport protein
MSDFKRLGKRGSHRFGAVSVRWWLVSCAVAAAVLGLGASSFGLWWLPFVAGLLAGASSWRVRSALLWVLVAVGVGWGVALWWPALAGNEPAGATARVVAALAGLPAFAAVGVAGTLLIGVLQGLVAVWLARALRPHQPSAPISPPPPSALRPIGH